MAEIVLPKALRSGDAIGIVVPAGPLNRERIDRGIARLKSRGFRVKTYGDIYRSRGYLAGDDATRAAEVIAAFEDPDTSAVWCGRGGYGVMRLLDRIDFEAIRRNPKVFIGFSDITALHVAIGQQTGLVTFHAPNVQDGFGKDDDMPAVNQSALWSIIGDNELSESASNIAVNAPPDQGAAYTYQAGGLENEQLRSICGGVATGRLTGGNLAVLSGLMGTPFEPETAGCILFLEDIGERLYRIDRFVTQLKLAGKLESAAGIILGGFSYEDTDHHEEPSDVAAFFDEALRPLGIPVLAGFPAGHERINLALPMGARIKLDADAGQVTLLEPAVVLSRSPKSRAQ